MWFPHAHLHFPYARLTLNPRAVPILPAVMRLALLFLCLLALAVPAGWAATRPAGSLSIEDGRGSVVLKGRGIVIGRLEKGDIQIVDLTPLDQWSPRLNGVPRGRTVWTRGKDINFYVPGGRYRITVHGEGFSISARGQGMASLDGSADAGRVDRDVRGGRQSARAAAADARARAVRRPVGGPVTGPTSVLVVEDEQSIASFVSLYLKNAGYGVRAVGTGSGALNAVAAEMPSLIVLDLNLPDMDGIEICRRIRKSSDVPIIMLTARDEDVDKIIGLEVGADDYLTKPFNPRELVARVKSVLRRATSDRRIDEGDEIRHGDLLINSGRREVLVGDREIQLAPKEFDLLWELLDHRGIVLTRDQLLERVWGYTFAGDTRTVDVHVRQIRRKLEDASPIVTVWGVGYKVASERTPAPAA